MPVVVSNKLKKRRPRQTKPLKPRPQTLESWTRPSEPWLADVAAGAAAATTRAAEASTAVAGSATAIAGAATAIARGAAARPWSLELRKPRSPVSEWESEWDLEDSEDSNWEPFPKPPPAMCYGFPPPNLNCGLRSEVRMGGLPRPVQPPLDSQWIITITEKLNQAPQIQCEASSSWSTLSIYRIPKSLRDVHETAYVPQIVSIGPYHIGLRRLGDMDYEKWRVLRHALNRAGHDVRTYLDAAASFQNDSRACYEALHSLSDKALEKYLVLDAIFALELFRGIDKGFPSLNYGPNGHVFANRGTILSLRRDMIKLENQLPLFVLDRILSLHEGHNPPRSGLVAPLALRFFNPLMPTNTPDNSSVDANADSSDALHCLDLFRQNLLGKGPQEASVWPDAEKRQLINCITELCDAGIKFRCRINYKFWDISFEDGVLHIPPLVIHDGTKLIFPNLIAFEQCHLKCDKHITSYVIFMNKLINSEVEVGYLRRSGIIEHCGNDREVADWFNGLCREVVFDINDSYLSKLSGQVNAYCDHKLNAWRASLIHKYFSNPWTIISFFVTIVMILFAFTQTFYAVYGHHKLN